MKILFLHGWTSVVGGRKPTFLIKHGHEVINPALPDEDFEESVRIAEAEYDEHQPDVIVGSSRGGAVAVNMDSGTTPLVLLCPAWKNWGSATKLKPNSVILHSCKDDVIPFADSEELIANSGLPPETLIEVGSDHRLAADEPLMAMLEACERLADGSELADVTVYYLEMLASSQRDVPAPRDGLMVLQAQTPSVPYYWFLYDAVGKEYNWLSRRKLSDAELAVVIGDPKNELHVLYVDGSPAGLAELDRQDSSGVELVHFGLMSEFIGQGLGKWFLQWTIDKAWNYQPKRLWLHTCTLDHPVAVPTYKKAGFAQFKEEKIRREV
jgi:GNAT superfamily N-acetyltransferase